MYHSAKLVWGRGCVDTSIFSAWAAQSSLKSAWPGDEGRWSYNMKSYEKWVTGLYADEVIERFGSLEVVDPTLIPVGMVQLFRASRLRWDQ